jgi:polar amino acid transport system substrate-binding protein
MTRTGWRRWALGAAAVLIGVTACSSSSKSSVTAGSPAPATTSGSARGAIRTASADPAAITQLPASIKSKGTLAVGLDASYAPDELIGPDGHSIIGLDVDLSTAIGQVLGLRAQPQNATFDTIIPGLLSGKFDMGASSFTDTKAREQQVDFVTYFTAGEGFYVTANGATTFNGLDSLCGHKVSVEKGTTEETDAQTQAKTCQSSAKGAVTVLSLQDQNAANLAVSSGRADVGFADSQVAAYIVQQSNGQFKLSGQPFSTAPYGLALPKNGLAPAVLTAVKDLMSDGIYLEVLQKWGVQPGAISNPVINGATS